MKMNTLMIGKEWADKGKRQVIRKKMNLMIQAMTMTTMKTEESWCPFLKCEASLKFKVVYKFYITFIVNKEETLFK